MLFGRNKKNPIKIADKKVVEWKYTTCGYCSTGCSIEVGLNAEGKGVAGRGVGDAPVNQGKLCIKGIFEYELFNSANRGKVPLMRDKVYRPFLESTWDKSLDFTAQEITRIQEKYGRDSFAIISTGQILTEEFYTLGKLARGVIGTNNYDGNTTLCMSSAVSGYKRSFGSDGPPGCYDDFDHTECLMAFGSNLPEQHPIIYWRLKMALEKRKFPVIVVDPRVTMFAQMADIHLPITPGTDVVLLNAMAHVILKEGLAEQIYIDAHTTGFEEFSKLVEQYDPVTASKICGIDEDTIRHVARVYAKAGAAMSIWTMGINQSTHGSDGVVGINSLNLITGNIGKPGGTSLSITGQCNAMGTREWSSCSGLPGYRALEKEKDREEIAKFWGIDASFFPEKRGMFMTDILPAIETGQIKGLWLIATNPMTSMPNTPRIRKTLEKLEFLVVQDAYSDVETTQYAHVYLPAALWGEKEGVFTNTERRVNLVRKVMEPHGDAKSDMWIFNQLAKRFEQGRKMRFPEKPSEVFDEMRELSKGRMLDYSGMDHDKIEKHRGLQWPCTEGAEAGSPRLYTDGVFQYPDGKAKLIPLPFIDNNERPDDDYPFWMNSGRVVEHFHTRTRTGKIGNMNKFSPTPYMEMNPDAAKKLGIEHMGYARLISRRGDAVVMVQLTQRVPPNMAFIPFHFHECVNRLTLGLLDPHSRQPAFKQCAVKIEPAVCQQTAASTNVASRTF
ncbi:molybdopterin oxidoreductase family protein [Sulfurirhabdus autotrophica]|uniref:Nitrate reductase (Quinol-dependent) catalytic subunit n=1 Tax=Sulfurirhabdus autotrophica TaxID=1706046 RepID=A0A4R3XQJ4_9PROT|nr:nitrate reductase [Sulfurirhabdus autotrophica]TCV81051.1 nitrate reductase (quinol-dependent) catalytic subunit [Sulfurirhabdus autotrophica]